MKTKRRSILGHQQHIKQELRKIQTRLQNSVKNSNTDSSNLQSVKRTAFFSTESIGIKLLGKLPLNIFDRRLIDNGMLKLLSQEGLEVHARSIFLQGLLLMSQEQRPVYFRKWDKLWHKWHRWLETEKTTALEAALWFALKDKRITTMVIGVNSAKQLQEIIDVSKKNTGVKLSDFSSSDIKLINPSEWSF